MSVDTTCRHFGLSRQAYYQQRQALIRQSSKACSVIQLVQAKRLKLPRLGTRKLYYLLKPEMARLNLKIGRDRLFEVLRGANMLVKPSRAYHKTTQSHHRFWKHPNLINGEHKIAASRSEQVWVADITYIPTKNQTVYLSLVTDMYSRKIVGYHVHSSLHTDQVVQALQMAVRSRKTKQELIHHSDRGIQYCSHEYQQIHSTSGIICSMTDGYDCYQNALAERVNGILKQEFLLQMPADLAQARELISESIELYNSMRPHLSLEYKTPDEVHQASVNQVKTVNLFQD